MGYYFGKGAMAPTDVSSAAPTTNGAVGDNQGECMQTCNERYQKDLDNPSVDYAEAQKRYNDCKMSCQDIPAIQEQVGSAYEATVQSKPKPEPVPPGSPPPGPTPPGPGFPGGTDCANKCEQELAANLEKGMHYPAALELWKKCYAKCEGSGPIACAGGYESNTKVDGVYPDCKEGMEPRTMPNGTRWCCPGGGDVPEGCVDFIEGQACEEGYEIKMYNGVRYCCPAGVGPGPGEGCEGGHILDDRFNDGKGKGLRPLTESERAPHIPEGWFRSSDWQGHIIWHPDYGYRDLKETHDYYESGSSDWTNVINSACEKGMERRTIGSEEWCCPAEGGGGGGGGGLGEYQWPAELQELYSLLMGRGKEFMGMETGYTDEAIRAMFGRDFENIRDVGARTAETGLSALQREGLMGTGASQDLASEAAWGTEQGISNIMRDLLVSSEEKKKQDLLDYTGAAQGIFGGGMGYNSLLEQINAGRRGEGRESLAMMLQYLMSLMSSWGA